MSIGSQPVSHFRFCPLCAAPLEPVPDGPDEGRPRGPTGHFVHYENPAVTVSPGDAVRREVAEETGLEVEPERILGGFASRYGDDGRWTVDIGFECRVTGGAWRLDPESTDAAWHPLDEMPDLAFAGERAGHAALRAARG
jgi:8-oxo-dGTP pyrophosphatase MutT (NUDIX family)